MIGRTLLVAVLMLTLALPAFGQRSERFASGDGIELAVAWSPEQPTLLEVVTLGVTVTHEAGRVLRVSDAIEAASDPTLADEVLGPMLGDFLVRSIRTDPPVRTDDGRIARRWTIELEPFVPGSASLPALGFAIDGGGRVRTDAATIEVLGVIAEGDDALDVGGLSEPLEPPEPSRFPWGGVVFVTIVSLIALLLGTLGYAVLKSLRQPAPMFERAFEQIRERREAIEADPGASERELREAYRHVAELFAKCIGVRLEPRAPRLSTEELSRLADAWFGLTELDRAELGETLVELDAARYANAAIERDSTLAMLRRSERLLERVRAASELVVDDGQQDEDGEGASEAASGGKTA